MWKGGNDWFESRRKIVDVNLAMIYAVEQETANLRPRLLKHGLFENSGASGSVP